MMRTVPGRSKIAVVLSSNSTRRMKTYTGIDYTYAPESYWSDPSPLAAILRNVKGENRRHMLRKYWAAGDAPGKVNSIESGSCLFRTVLAKNNYAQRRTCCQARCQRRMIQA